MLERELGSGVSFFGNPVDVSPQALCLDTILDVGIGLGRSHLDTDTTLRHFREHLWCPDLMDRSGWDGPKTDETVLQRMQKEIGSLLSAYEKPEVDPDKLHQMREVVEKAREVLLG